MVDNVASTYSQENAKEAFWRWLTKGGTQDPGVTGPSVSGAGASKGTPALTLGTTNAAGSASTFVATDATIAEFDATVPTTQAFNDAAATGSAGTAARRDHKHAMPTTDTAFTAPTLLNSWANFGSGFYSAGYFKDANGFVHLRGVVKTGAATTNIFLLPSGYRPSAQEMCVQVGNNGGADIITRVDVKADGNVYHQGPTASTYLSLDGITFYAGS